MRPRDNWHLVLYSKEPSGVVLANVMGPVQKGRGGVRYIQCLVDSATRKAQATKHKNMQSVTILKGMDQWLQKLGRIGILVTDNAGYYESEEVARWCKENGVEKRSIAPYRHQSVGLVERFNRKLENALRKITLAEGGCWSDHLDRAVDALNASVHDTTGYTPDELWEGDDVIRRIALERTNTWRQRRNAKVRRKYPFRFELGMQVLVRNQDYETKNKFAPKWKGPFVLKERISNTMWRAELWSQLKVFRDDPLYGCFIMIRFNHIMEVSMRKIMLVDEPHDLVLA